MITVSLQELWYRWRWPHLQRRVWDNQEQLPIPQQVWRTGQEPVRISAWQMINKMAMLKKDIYIYFPALSLTGLILLFPHTFSLAFFSTLFRDGKISREEMIDYFMKASSLLNCKMGFIHTFNETTYVKPTFCEHCAGFVSIQVLQKYLK